MSYSEVGLQAAREVEHVYLAIGFSDVDKVVADLHASWLPSSAETTVHVEFGASSHDIPTQVGTIHCHCDSMEGCTSYKNWYSSSQ